MGHKPRPNNEAHAAAVCFETSVSQPPLLLTVLSSGRQTAADAAAAASFGLLCSLKTQFHSLP